MAREKNYEAKIEMLKAKIATKSAQLKSLKEELAKLEEEQRQVKYNELLSIIDEKALPIEDVLTAVKGMADK